MHQALFPSRVDSPLQIGTTISLYASILPLCPKMIIYNDSTPKEHIQSHPIHLSVMSPPRHGLTWNCRFPEEIIVRQSYTTEHTMHRDIPGT